MQRVRRFPLSAGTMLIALGLLLVSTTASAQQKKPNTFVIWGDDIGVRLGKAVSKSPQWFAGLRSSRSRRTLTATIRWICSDKMWTMVPAQTVVGEYFETLKEFPPTRGSRLRVDQVLKQLQTQKARQ